MVYVFAALRASGVVVEGTHDTQVKAEKTVNGVRVRTFVDGV